MTQAKKQLVMMPMGSVTVTEREKLGQQIKVDCLLYVTAMQSQTAPTNTSMGTPYSFPWLCIPLTGELGLRKGRPVKTSHCSPPCRLLPEERPRGTKVWQPKPLEICRAPYLFPVTHTQGASKGQNVRNKQ